MLHQKYWMGIMMKNAIYGLQELYSMSCFVGTLHFMAIMKKKY